MSQNIFDLRHMSKVAAQFQKKNKMFVYSFKYLNKESAKNEAAKPHSEPYQIYTIERFCENTNS